MRRPQASTSEAGQEGCQVADTVLSHCLFFDALQRGECQAQAHCSTPGDAAAGGAAAAAAVSHTAWLSPCATAQLMRFLPRSLW